MDNIAHNEAMPVMLGGKSWIIPPLAAKQNKIIDPLILKLLPVFAEWQNDRAGALTKIGAAQYDALLEIAFVAIQSKTPELAREQFLELPVTLMELIAAFNVIAQQTGIFQKPDRENSLGEVAGV